MMECLAQDQIKMKKDMDCMKGKVDQILKTVTTMAKYEWIQQDATIRNVIPMFHFASQPILINRLYGVPLGYYP